MREPRIEAARRKVKPVPSWKLVYESYTPLSEPWPSEVLPVILIAQGIIWAQGGSPDPAALCQIMAQTDHGMDIDAPDEETLWMTLVDSLEALAWNDSQSKLKAFASAAGILAAVERKAERFGKVAQASVESANAVIADLNEAEAGQPVPAEPEQHEDNADYDAVSDPTGLMCAEANCTQPAVAVIGDAALCGFHYPSGQETDQ